MMIPKYIFIATLAFLFAFSHVSIVQAPPLDTNPPNIATPSIDPSSPTASDAVTVTVRVNDPQSGVKNVTVHYTTDNWQNVNVSIFASYNATTEIATIQIPPYGAGTHVAYYVVAFDNSENRAMDDNNGNYFSYDVAVPAYFNTIAYIGVAAAIAAVAGLALFIALRKPSTGSRKSPSKTDQEQWQETDYRQ